ncbi:MAG: AraC family transcriptional regulator [Firmicutes bacterium]|nr:AraC family transcriptional regulator [Bacillota bacterium]
MDGLKARVAYVKGLAEGLGLDESSREGKLFRHMIDLFDVLADAVTKLQEDYAELADYTEAIDEDLNDLEDDFYDDFDDEDEDKDEAEEEEETDFDDDDEVFSVECPECHEIVYIDDDMLEDDDVVEILCPNCERVVFVNDKEDYEDFGEYKAEDKEKAE